MISLTHTLQGSTCVSTYIIMLWGFALVRGTKYKVSDIISVGNVRGGVDETKYTRLCLYQPLQYEYACRLLLRSSDCFWNDATGA